MGWGQWEWDRARDAEEFLRTGDNISGIASDYGSLANSEGTSSGGNCFRSTECGSGFACVNGECINVSGGNTTNSGGGTTSGNPSGPGINCDPDDPESPCGKSTGGSCDIPGCGQNPKPGPNDCCGTRSCQFTGGYVICSCGDLPEDKPCNQFCDSWFKSFGTLAAGCGESKQCSECSSCFAQACEPGNGPCWCDAGESCGDCEKCDTDPESTNFGSCVPADCQECSTIYNYDCGCGKILDEVTACRSSLSSGPSSPNLAQAKARAYCAEICDSGGTPVDPCKGECESKSYCSDTTGPPPACPPYTTCTDTGTISAGGVTCWLRNECNKENVPESCEACDCNCNNDCSNCQLCGTDGKCYDDPACDGDDLMVRVVETQTVYVGNWICSKLVTEDPSCIGDFVLDESQTRVNTQEYTFTKQAYDAKQTVYPGDSGKDCSTAPRYSAQSTSGPALWYGSGTAAAGGDCPLDYPSKPCPNNAPGTNFCSTFNPQGSYYVYSTSVSYFMSESEP